MRTVRIVIKHSGSVAAGILRVRAAMHDAFRPMRQFMSSVRLRPRARRLKLSESVSLGGDRFVALIRVDDQDYLVGGGPDSLVLLAQPGGTPSAIATAHQIGANSVFAHDSPAARGHQSTSVFPDNHGL